MDKKLDFTRSNVTESMLNMSQPERSTLDLYHTHRADLPIGKFIPVNIEKIMPNSVVAGTCVNEFTLENVGTPEVGKLRLDTHTVAVSARRINTMFKKVIAGTAEDLPAFQVDLLFADVLGALLGVTDLVAFDNVYCTNKGQLGTRLYDVELIYTNAINFFVTNSSPAASDFGYLKDHFSQMAYRLSVLRRQYTVAHYNPDVPLAAKDGDTYECLLAIYHVMEPFFGEGSIIDHIKYPIFGFYGPVLTWARAMHDFQSIDDGQPDLPYTHPYNVGISDWLTDFASLLRAVDIRKPDALRYEVPYFENYEFYRMSEDPLRVIYAAWYDCLRNWHVEDAAHLSDIDQWNNNSIIENQSSVIGKMTFLLPRFRCWGSDPWTTIQTDDVFRHVFNPIFTQSGSYISTANPDDGESALQTIFESASALFPQPLHRFIRGAESEWDFWYNDLQSMRRAGWQERYLARMYYTPDTYAGRIYASWGVTLDDISTTSKYISGSEGFLTGEQLKASTGTDGIEGTPAGTRTFSGGLQTTEQMSFASQADFCYLVTFASLMPIPEYDALDMHCYETERRSLPFSEFATDTRVQIMSADMIRGLARSSYAGYVPKYLQYRATLDSVHGEYLRRYRSFLWLRDWYSVRGAQFYANMVNHREEPSQLPDDVFTIGAYGLHVHVNLDAFNGKEFPTDSVAYGKCEFNLAVECPLPAAIENI